MDGHEMTIKFPRYPWQLPHTRVFNDDGGYIIHRQSKRHSDFVEREGVYFIEMNTVGAVTADNAESGVARRGK